MNERVVLSLALLLLVVAPLPVISQESYEVPSSLKAAEVLPDELLSGEHFKVDDEVVNDGFMNHYTVTSDYGPFTAYGNLELAVLVHQIHAIAVLDEISDTEAFAKAVGRSAKGEIDTIKDFAGHPVGTVKGVPGGIKHMFKKYKKQADAGYEAVKAVGAEAIPGGKDEEKDSDQTSETSATKELADQATDAATGYAEQWFGVTGSERHWYKKLGVDPYNRNAVLQKMVKHMSKVEAAAHVGMKFVPSIPGVGYLSRVNHAVWDVDPAELRAENIKRLQEVGVDAELIDRFMDNKNLSPSQQTLALSTLAHLKGVDGLQVLLEIAAEADTPELAQFNLANTLYLAFFHKYETPLSKVLAGEPVPVALTSTNGLVIIASVDHAFWEEDLAGVIEIMAEKFADQEVTSREMFLRGAASRRFLDEVGELGWTVNQMIGLDERVDELFVNPAQPQPAGDGASEGESEKAQPSR